MIKPKANLANDGHPFPYERPRRALRDEDAFMALHGGFGARAILIVAGWPMAAGQGLITLGADIATRLARLRRPPLPQEE